jgi:hypothetical protein
MPALGAGIHALLCGKDVDGRDQPGHDGVFDAYGMIGGVGRKPVA